RAQWETDMTQHGIRLRGMSASRGINVPSGRFGRLFPGIEPRRPTGVSQAAQFGAPGGLMDGGQTTLEQDNPNLPSGFTYLGQFIDHNITFDATSVLGQQVDPDAVVDFRPARLDLDNLYGCGPTVEPYLYDKQSSRTKFPVADNAVDLARSSDGTALIGDPRNDENLILAQLHLAFSKFHNKVVDGLQQNSITDVFGDFLPPGPPPPPDPSDTDIEDLLDRQSYFDELFTRAQQLVRWHYQWLIVHQFLPLTVGDVAEHVREHGPRFYRPGRRPFIPVEFAVAAFRFGHPTVRSSYLVNQNFAAPIFSADPNTPPDPRTDLRGGPVKPGQEVDWSFFFETSVTRRPQHARKTTATLATPLLDLPDSAIPGAATNALTEPLRSLAVRNLLRSETQQLPSGQDVARKVGERVLTDEELGTTGPIYLWYYLLKEAELLAHGNHLGPVGGRIVAEVLEGILHADPTSYVSAFPAWKPTLADADGQFGIVQLLRFAGVA
ncbi:MAG: peroxidase family protein, partial [Sciscionella sp.]